MKMKKQMQMLFSSYPNFKEKKKEVISIKFAKLNYKQKIRAMGDQGEGKFHNSIAS